MKNKTANVIKCSHRTANILEFLVKNKKGEILFATKNMSILFSELLKEFIKDKTACSSKFILKKVCGNCGKIFLTRGVSVSRIHFGDFDY